MTKPQNSSPWHKTLGIKFVNVPKKINKFKHLNLANCKAIIKIHPLFATPTELIRFNKSEQFERKPNFSHRANLIEITHTNLSHTYYENILKFLGVIINDICECL